jgi:hypothetical protein
VLNWRSFFNDSVNQSLDAEDAKPHVRAPQDAPFAVLHTNIRDEETLEAVLAGKAVELWSDVNGRLFIVADEADAQFLMKSDTQVMRGEVYTAAELRRIIKIADPIAVAEVHRFKREFNSGILQVERSTGQRQ